MKRITAIAIAAACLIGSCYVGTVGAAEQMPDEAAFQYCHDTVERDTPNMLPKSRDALAVACLLGVTAHLNGMSGEEFRHITDGVVAKGESGDVYKRTAATRTAVYMAEGFLYSRSRVEGSK
jgi:hypothetical protein|nr:MAG TPA: foot protein [Caudoviricetes sp.]